MKRIGLALSVFALIWMGVSALHLTNPYLRSSEFIEVSVSRGENVWTIARRFATKETMVEQLEEAIIEVNGLAPDGAVAAGRRLRVPVMNPPSICRQWQSTKPLTRLLVHLIMTLPIRVETDSYSLVPMGWISYPKGQGFLYGVI